MIPGTDSNVSFPELFLIVMLLLLPQGGLLYEQFIEAAGVSC